MVTSCKILIILASSMNVDSCWSAQCQSSASSVKISLESKYSTCVEDEKSQNVFFVTGFTKCFNKLFPFQSGVDYFSVIGVHFI